MSKGGVKEKKNPRGRDEQRRHLNASLHILSNTNVFSVSVVIWSGSSRCPVATQRSTIYQAFFQWEMGGVNHSHLASIFISPVHFALAIFLQNGRIKAVDADKPESVCCWQQSRFAERDLSSPEPDSAFSHSVLCDEIGFFCVSTCVLQLWQILATCVPLNGTVSVQGESNELKNVSVVNYLANNKKNICSL